MKYLSTGVMSIQHTFGQNVKSARKASQLTQEALALEIDINQAHISNIESGNIKDLSIQTVGRLAKALNTTPARLLDGCHLD
ncbi:MAG: transcriptional regulator [Rhodospirillaceae bacterium]|nr:MAG: transcriptional regulator [Rhodospirillaceae bacterium]